MSSGPLNHAPAWVPSAPWPRTLSHLLLFVLHFAHPGKVKRGYTACLVGRVPSCWHPPPNINFFHCTEIKLLWHFLSTSFDHPANSIPPSSNSFTSHPLAHAQPHGSEHHWEEVFGVGTTCENWLAFLVSVGMWLTSRLHKRQKMVLSSSTWNILSPFNPTHSSDPDEVFPLHEVSLPTLA